MLNIVLIILLLVIFGFIVYPNISNEHFQATKYEIGYDKETKEIELTNISSKLMGDKISGFKLSGEGSYITVPNFSIDSYTISFIVFLDEVVNRQYLVSYGWELYIEDGNLTIRNNNQKYVFSKEIKPSEYNHIAIKYSNNKLTLFVDGTELEYETKNVPVTNTLLFGTNKAKNTFMVGMLGEIHLYSDLLSNTQLCSLHDSCKLKSCNFEPNGNTRDECYKNCMNSSDNDCRDEACNNKCYNKSTSTWKAPCSFKPYGSDIFSCMNHCVTKNNCNYKNCQEICQDCKDKDVCPWVKDLTEETPENPRVVIDTNKLDGKPIAPKIYLLPYNGKFLIKWKKPDTYTEQEGDINEYVCFIYKTLNKNEGVQMTKVPYPKCTDCEFVINDLDKDTYYTVGVRAYNQKGLSDMSNLVSMKPQYKSTKKPVAAVPTEAPQIIERTEYCNATN